MRGAEGDRWKGKGAGTALLILLSALLFGRLLTLGAAPLFDTTEGRYGEIGRAMAASGDWITPTLPGGEPFWAKPPLHFWMTAASISLFGANEWAARLPGFLAAVATLLLVCRAARSWGGGREEGMLAVVILGSSLLLVLLSGVVLLDVTFTLAVTGVFASFIAFLRGVGGRGWGVLFFLFLSLGLLAKGPVVLALVFLPLLVWAILRRRGKALRSLPWVAGAALVLVVAAPWFVLAERKTPGFWNYFFIHEHVLRYLQSDYGDRYGHGHVSPYGLVWILAFAAFLPWSPAAVGMFRRFYRAYRAAALEDETILLLSWALVPLLFFTFSRSLSFPYVLPSLPPLALLLAREVTVGGYGRLSPAWGVVLSPLLVLAGALYGLGTLGAAGGQGLAIVGTALLLLGAAVVALGKGSVILRVTVQVAIFPLFLVILGLALPAEAEDGKSTRHLRNWVRENAGALPEEVFFFDGPPLSASFYFGGSARDLSGDEEEIRRLWRGGGGEILFVREDRRGRITEETLSFLSMEGKSGEYLVFRLRPRGGRA